MKKTVRQSLGWLSQSGKLPSKRKPIEGVGASSMKSLRTQVQERLSEKREAKRKGPSFFSHSDDIARSEYIRRKQARGAARSDALGKRNRGVEDRNRKDLEAAAAREAERAGALERKAELYDKLSRGERGSSDQYEAYHVDFGKKEAPPRPPRPAVPSPPSSPPSDPARKAGSAKIAALKEKLRRAKAQKTK